MSIHVIRPGLLTTIQDLGRFGFQKYGVVVSGAMDILALRIANLLVGNHEAEGALEITLVGPTLQVHENCLIAITGADIAVTIDEERIPLWRPVYIKKGAIIRFGKCLKGCRAYLAVAGGFDIPKIMGSHATYLRGGFGGYNGRALAEKDILKLKKISDLAKTQRYRLSVLIESKLFTTDWFVNYGILSQHKHVTVESIPVIRFIEGKHFSFFTPESRRRFLVEKFQLTPQSDRMGYRLSGPILELHKPFQMISEAVTAGTIQVPEDGNPIALMADRQTTGGYPQIAHIATVDLPQLAQIRPGEWLCFQEISLKEAQEIYIKREVHIQQIKQAIRLKQ